MIVRWSPLAIERLVGIAETIRLDKVSAADDWLKRISESVMMLENLPRRGRVVPETNHPDLRELLLGGYRVIYRIEGERLSVLTVRHGRRLLDPDELM